MQKVVIFGAGNCGRLIGANLMQDKNVEIIAFIDNDPQKAGQKICLENTQDSTGGGVSIYSSPKLLELDFDKVIVGTFTGLYEISEQLESMGIPKAKIDVGYIELSVKARIVFLQDFAKISQHLEGSVAELGVYRGDFARYINESFRDKTLYLFDTFEGFTHSDVSKDSTMAHSLGAKHFANTSVELVLSKMPYKERCVIKKGWFPQSAVGLENERFCFVNLDCDLYEPILAGLRYFYPKMVKGGVILCHEYFSQGYVGVREAVMEFIAESSDEIYTLPIGDNLSIALIKT
ncbi:putative O-methyltransferase [Helicobacter cinaedi PAGU611]|uniref:Methyltransferase n=6 Tax=Helicobacter cinaedi TaxID=213 RepID=A0ABN0BAZ7_9HELI|nr:TylF/MycF/NovP-related O-methyltransferase [Helicobacter cinaedi]EFR46696.1 hypothetical protein HCCG_01243 [Helicobacter cinaedi CCUG 18818 = ATCC BAA-847]BAM12288.1 putative O-methyltransferase [Helicobacter cinaedi PAGU611]